MLTKIRLKDFLSDTKGFGYHVKTGWRRMVCLNLAMKHLTIIILFTTFPWKEIFFIVIIITGFLWYKQIQQKIPVFIWKCECTYFRKWYANSKKKNKIMGETSPSRVYGMSFTLRPDRMNNQVLPIGLENQTLQKQVSLVQKKRRRTC